jgi:transcriptional regulator of arginine metabolism
VTSTPTAPLTKTARQSRVGELIAGREVRSQAALVELLAEDGIVVTQATLSRDLDELGARKVRATDGTLVYALGDSVEPSPPPGRTARLSRLAEELVTSCEAAGNLVVVRTPPGGAHFLASAVDGAGLTEVAGTVAGDDTVLLVCRIADPVTDPTGAVAASRLAERLLRLADGHPAEPTS